MKTSTKLIALAGVATALFAGSLRSIAQGQGGGGQGRGNFDPEQMRQRMMERYKQQLDVKSDDEWKIIQDRIEKVTTARREAGAGGGFGMMGFGGRRGGPGGGGAGGVGGAAADGGG